MLKRDFSHMGSHESVPMTLRRRGFLAAAAGFPFHNELALAQLSYVGGATLGGVMINANEFPLGPCSEAKAAMREMIEQGGRYFFGESLKLAEALARVEGMPPDSVAAFAGSSDPLHRTVLAVCGKGASFVTADPGYEAGERAAEWLGVPVHRVPIRKDYAHDTEAMLQAAAGKSALFYICNPNNPTGTVTPKAEIESLVEKMPGGSVALIDEAYIHFAGIDSSKDLVLKGKDVVVLRTFSKIFGMAGLRAGAAMAKPALLSRIRPYGTGYVPTTGMVGARVSLGVKGLVEDRRHYVSQTRESVFEWLERKHFAYVPSRSNKFMIDVKRPAREVIAALASDRVYVGRVWPSWPTHIRVTIGTPEEMEKFKTAFAKAMA
jgi:histidinol-phosphate aminotransferase